MQKSPKVAASQPSYEDLFLQRYDWLIDSALRLVGRDRELAEDLVHDVFIHFTLDRPELERLQNIDGYLYAMLRNMHISQIRRNARIRATNISSSQLAISDYDFVADGLQAIEHRTQQTRDELCRICHYACVRKKTSKAGSVLVLRFLHGYYPSEIARILRSTRASADKWLQIARSEVKLYLTNPNALAFIGSTKVELPLSDALQSTEDFVNELRKVVFESQPGECFTTGQLQELYLLREAIAVAPIDCRTLSHVVSCRFCLDQVNILLGLPLLQDRYPTKTLGQDKSNRFKGPDSGEGGASSGSGGGNGRDDFISRSRRRLQRVIQHRPQQLRISVNGFILGSQDVGAEFNRQTVSIKGDEKIGFVEIFSEQEERLLFTSVDPPPDGPVRHRRRVVLSDDRTLELTLDFSEPWPNLDVVYHDPSFAIVNSLVLKEASPFPDGNGQGQRETRQLESTAPGAIPAHPARWQGDTTISERQERANGSGLTFVLQELRKWTLKLRIFLRPGTVTMVVAALLFAILLLPFHNPTISPRADLLLQQSALVEERAATQFDQVLHRRITLEERSSMGTLISRNNLDIWQSAERGTARRLYDESGHLVKGDWRQTNGMQTLYQHGSRMVRRLPSEKQTPAAIDFDNVWQFNPTAKQFVSLVGATNSAQVQESSGAYIISMDRGTSASGLLPGLLKATLILKRSEGELHAVEQTLIVRQSEETREYRFVEVSFERHVPAAVRPAVFEPDAQLLTYHAEPHGSRETDLTFSSPDLPHAAAPAVATPALELEVLRLLSGVGADLGEQITVTRTTTGQLRVEGLVDSEQRKEEVLAALGPVRKNAAVVVSVSTVADALAQQNSRNEALGPSTVLKAQTQSNAAPIEPTLRRYFSSQGRSEKDVDEEVRSFCGLVLQNSMETMLHAWALKRLGQRFSLEDLSELSPEAKATWYSLIREHASAFNRRASNLRLQLAPIFPLASSTTDELGVSAIDNDAALLKAIESLFHEATSNDQLIRAAFAVSTATTSADALKTQRFWISFRKVEARARAIANR